MSVATEKKGNPITAAVFWFWVFLLVPWVFFRPLSALAFDGGYTLEAYVFLWSVASYPIMVIVTAFTRKRIPATVSLPL